MNDLAEKALQATQAVGRQLARRPVPLFALGGFLAAAVVVVAGGRLGAARDALPMTRWLDLLAPAGYHVSDNIPAIVLVLGIGALIALWVGLLHFTRRRIVSEGQTWMITAAWMAPFAFGPPLMSTDIYSSVAHGLLARHGLDPYQHAPTALGHLKIVNAIDPTWRDTASTGGPLSTFVEHFATAVAGGNALTAVVLMRTLAVVCVLAIGALAAELAGPRHVDAVALTAANPAVLLYLVSGAHLDALMIALLLGALLAASQRRWTIAIVLACLAAGVKPIALVALPAFFAVHAIGQRSHIAWRVLIRDVITATITLVASVFVVTDGMGWIGNVSETTHEHTFWAPANLLSDMISPVLSSASYDDLAVGGRVAALLAAVTAVIYLLLTVLTRPIERTTGYLLLAVGLLSPVLYPWYLLWGVLCLAPAVTRTRRDWVVALSAAAALLTPPGFSLRTGRLATTAGLVVIAGGLVFRQVMRRRARASV